MHDSASPHSRRTDGIQRRIPAIPMSEWRITTPDRLPDNLKRILADHSPNLSARRAAELSGGGVSKLYELKDEGVVRYVKDGGSTLWETLSIVLRLANLPSGSAPVILPPAPIKMPSISFGRGVAGSKS
jgi:hypothetical protein